MLGRGYGIDAAIELFTQLIFVRALLLLMPTQKSVNGPALADAIGRAQKPYLASALIWLIQEFLAP
ncbi:hypothetical protein ASD31_22405 [Rhizobium sp. Root482]|nr:hypothetical protein ASD31_22405 [Rhizobium sp. Root482]